MSNKPQKIIKGYKGVMDLDLTDVESHKHKSMIEQHNNFPHFGWNKNKGYGTKLHIENIYKYGLTKLHRKTFKIKELQIKLEL